MMLCTGSISCLGCPLSSLGSFFCPIYLSYFGNKLHDSQNRAVLNSQHLVTGLYTLNHFVNREYTCTMACALLQHSFAIRSHLRSIIHSSSVYTRSLSTRESGRFRYYSDTHCNVFPDTLANHVFSPGLSVVLLDV